MGEKIFCYLISPAFMLLIQPPHKLVHRIRHVIRKLLHHLLLLRRLLQNRTYRIHNRPDTISAFHQIIPHPLITARQRLLLDKIKEISSLRIINHTILSSSASNYQIIPRPPPNSNTAASKIPAYKIPDRPKANHFPQNPQPGRY